MRNTEERVRAARLGAEKIKKQRLERQVKGVSACTGLLSLSLILVLFHTLPPMAVDRENSAVTAEFFASVFANPQSLSHIIIGILSFALGVSVTVLCVLLHRRGERQEDDD